MTEVYENNFFNEHSWFFEHRLIGLFVLMLSVGGSTVTSLAGFLAKLGLFNFWVIVGFAILTSLTRNMAYYGIGRCGSGTLLKHGARFGLSTERVERIALWYTLYPIRTFFIIKNSPCMAAPGLAAAGLVRVPMRRYLFWITVNTIPNALLFAATGYLAGAAYAETVKVEALALGAFSFALCLLGWSYHRYFSRQCNTILDSTGS